MPSSSGYCQVAPRYTPGSPGMVDRSTAERIATEERAAYQRALEGVYGEQDRSKALLMGLRGISEVLYERGRGSNHRYDIHDLVTGEWFERPTPEVMQKLGFEQYRYLDDEAKAAIDAAPPTDMGDWRRTGWFKLAGSRWQPRAENHRQGLIADRARL